jgi:uncharacterized protein YkwD
MIVTLMTISFHAKAQDETIVLNEFDNTMLENMVFDKINEFRTASKLENLTRNANLDKAANSQAMEFK